MPLKGTYCFRVCLGRHILIYLKTYGLRMTIHSNPCESKKRRVLTIQEGKIEVTVEIQVRWCLTLRQLTTAGCYAESVFIKALTNPE